MQWFCVTLLWCLKRHSKGDSGMAYIASSLKNILGKLIWLLPAWFLPVFCFLLYCHCQRVWMPLRSLVGYVIIFYRTHDTSSVCLILSFRCKYKVGIIEGKQRDYTCSCSSRFILELAVLLEQEVNGWAFLWWFFHSLQLDWRGVLVPLVNICSW